MSKEEKIRSLFVSDVDGTLLRSDHVLPNTVATASRDLRNRGIALVLASARSPRGISVVMQSMSTAPLAICYNGAWVGNPLTGEALYRSPLEYSTAQIACDAIHSVCGTAMWCAADTVYALAKNAPSARPVAAVATDRLDTVSRMDAIVAKPLKILGVFNDGADRHCAAIRDRLTGIAHVQTSGNRFVEVTAPDVTKSKGAEHVRRHLDIAIAATFAAGDANNDLDLLNWASYPVTVANAIPEARALATQVFPSNEEGGMANAFRWAGDHFT